MSAPLRSTRPARTRAARSSASPRSSRRRNRNLGRRSTDPSTEPADRTPTGSLCTFPRRCSRARRRTALSALRALHGGPHRTPTRARTARTSEGSQASPRAGSSGSKQGCGHLAALRALDTSRIGSFRVEHSAEKEISGPVHLRSNRVSGTSSLALHKSRDDARRARAHPNILRPHLATGIQRTRSLLWSGFSACRLDAAHRRPHAHRKRPPMRRTPQRTPCMHTHERPPPNATHEPSYDPRSSHT